MGLKLRNSKLWKKILKIGICMVPPILMINATPFGFIK